MNASIEFLEDLQRDLLMAEFGPSFADRLRDEAAYLASSRPTQMMQQQQEATIAGIVAAAAKEGDSISAEEASKFLAQLRQRETGRRKVEQRLYSQYESPFFIDVIEEPRLRTEQSFQTMLREGGARFNVDEMQARFQSVVVGSLADHAFGASAIRVGRTDDYVITFNTGLPRFLSRLARIFVRLEKLVVDTGHVKREDYPSVAKAVLHDPRSSYLVENFIATIGDYFGMDFGASYDHKLFFGPERMMSEAMTISSETFVLAHEYAHILDRHHVAGWSELGIAALSRTIEVGRYAKEIEFAADAVGANALLTLIDHERKTHSEAWQLGVRGLLRGIAHFFACATIVETYQEIFGKHPLIPSTHPSPLERMQFLRATVGGEMAEELGGAMARNLAAAQLLGQLAAES